MTPEQLASKQLFGDASFVPGCPDIDHPDPYNMGGPRVSWNELVKRYRLADLTSDDKVYIGGPMRGYAEFNFPAFHAAADAIKALGCEVFNPAAKDNERHGTDISKGNAAGCEEVAAKEHGFNLREALGLDLAWICAEATAIALLPGWKNSKGATAEHATAVALGHKVVEL